MKKLTHLILLCMVIVLACKKAGIQEPASLPSATLDSSGGGEPLKPVDSMEMMKAWEAFMTPGDMHAMISKWAGTWDVDILSYMNGPESPEKSTGTNVVSNLMNGLYQQNTLKGTMMGAPFEGQGTIGFDNAKKLFVSTWIDNMGTGIVYMTGTWDDAAKMLRLKGTQSDPMTGKDAMIREELKVIDDNTHHLTMYGVGFDGKETKFMEATYKRRIAK